MGFKEAVVQTVSKISYKISANSPTILIVAGAVGIVTATVLACRSTLKAKEVVENSKKDMDMIHDCEANKTLEESGEYTKEDAKKDKVKVAVKTTVNLFKLYIIPIIIFVLSFWAIFASHGIMIRRNTAISAAYAGLAATFKDYRGRVVEKFGDGVDKELRYGLKAVDVEEEQKDEEGNVETVKTKKTVYDRPKYSDYARFFGKDYSDCATDDPEYNMVFLKETLGWLNRVLISRAGKPVYLNEVYDALGIERTDAGQVVGWRYLPDDKTHRGDNYISFGAFFDDLTKAGPAERRFVNGLESVVLLDFNVDGEVYQTMPRKSLVSSHVYGH